MPHAPRPARCRAATTTLVAALCAALCLALTGTAAPAPASAVASATPARAAATGPLPLAGYWSYAGGTVKVTARGGTITAVAATHLGLWGSGVNDCIIWRPGEAAWGAVTGSGLSYTGMVRWWDDTKDPCQPIGDDTQASFTVSRDGQSLEVCSTPPNDGWRQCYRASKRPTMVASLGDSYSAGEGAGGYDPASRGCHRSPYAWTKYLEARNPTRWHVESFLACSGAEMPNLTGTFKGEGPQVSRIHPFTEVVTVTIGGNDTGFSDVLTSCFLRWKLHQKNCVQKGKPYRQAKKFVRGPLASRLAASYQAIRAQAPKDARLVVVGYPRLFPLRGKAVRKCGWLVPQVRKALNGLAVELNNAIRATATRNGATFVDVLDTLSGHEACTGGASWVYPIKPATNAQAGHPMPPWQYALARRIGSVLGYS
ncbi:SGNH/GDSL hydrolase family protein [Pimelobacter simplex]|uniref:SGNH/GDSL hydrolase family protein n=1 Tax=Nocardioides simplex TaxID=2045 RepID=UPI003AAF6693